MNDHSHTTWADDLADLFDTMREEYNEMCRSLGESEASEAEFRDRKFLEALRAEAEENGDTWADDLADLLDMMGDES